MPLPVLDPVDQRILGALLEKQKTVPATYPLTLNALRTACNQSSSRDPLVDYDERTVEEAARALKRRELIRIVWADTGRRTLKYHQTLDEVLGLAADERALLTVLLLRGEQAPGELKTRTERLHAFAGRTEVEAVLARLAARADPLVRELPRRPGQQDNRWIHLLGPVAGVDDVAAVEPSADLDQVLADGGEARDARVRAAYGMVAATYAERLTGELADLPFESWLLTRVAEHAAGGPVVEAGCGPGHITDFLARAGADATGVDLTPEMIEQARRLFPGSRFEVGDLRRLMRPAAADGWAAVLGWYSLIHLGPSELPGAIGALARPLRPGGLLVLAMHAGGAVRHLDEWFELPVDLDAVLHDPATVSRVVEATGLRVLEGYLRMPLADRGETTQRFYLLAVKD